MHACIQRTATTSHACCDDATTRQPETSACMREPTREYIYGLLPAFARTCRYVSCILLPLLASVVSIWRVESWTKSTVYVFLYVHAGQSFNPPPPLFHTHTNARIKSKSDRSNAMKKMISKVGRNKSLLETLSLPSATYTCQTPQMHSTSVCRVPR